MEYCAIGSHPTLTAYQYDSTTWCPEHPCPSGPVDPLPAGVCEVGRTHQPLDGVRFLPVYGKSACRRHMGILVREVIRRGEFGR
jgi:hypothetical protein